MFCVIGFAMFSNVANAAICKDFDDDMNLVEYECGTSLSAAIKANKEKVEQQKLQKEAERKAKEKAEKLQREKEIAERVAKKQKKEAERATEKAKKEAERKAKEKAEKLQREKAIAERSAEKAKKEAERAAKKQKKEAERKAKAEAKTAEIIKLKTELQVVNVSVPVLDATWWKWLRFEPFIGFDVQIPLTDKKYRVDNNITLVNRFGFGAGLQLGLIISSEFSNEFLFVRYDENVFDDPGTYELNGGLACGLECVKNGGMIYTHNSSDRMGSINFGWGTNLYKSFNGYAGFGIGYYKFSFHKEYASYFPSVGGGNVEHYEEYIDRSGMSEKIFIGVEYKLYDWLRVYIEPTVVISKELEKPVFYVPFGGRIMF